MADLETASLRSHLCLRHGAGSDTGRLSLRGGALPPICHCEAVFFRRSNPMADLETASLRSHLCLPVLADRPGRHGAGSDIGGLSLPAPVPQVQA
jgi:hypothetical protein